jgi:hypothetical protein
MQSTHNADSGNLKIIQILSYFISNPEYADCMFDPIELAILNNVGNAKAGTVVQDRQTLIDHHKMVESLDITSAQMSRLMNARPLYSNNPLDPNRFKQMEQTLYQLSGLVPVRSSHGREYIAKLNQHNKGVVFGYEGRQLLWWHTRLNHFLQPCDRWMRAARPNAKRITTPSLFPDVKWSIVL